MSLREKGGGSGPVPGKGPGAVDEVRREPHHLSVRPQEWTGRATAISAKRFLDRLSEQAPFPVRAIEVDGGSDFMADLEQALDRRIDLLRPAVTLAPDRRPQPLPRRLQPPLQPTKTTPGTRRTHAVAVSPIHSGLMTSESHMY